MKNLTDLEKKINSNDPVYHSDNISINTPEFKNFIDYISLTSSQFLDNQGFDISNFKSIPFIK